MKMYQKITFLKTFTEWAGHFGDFFFKQIRNMKRSPHFKSLTL